MKKIILFAVSLIAAFSLCACGGADKEKQQAIMQYINEALAEAAEIEADMLESYYSVTGENFVDDYTAYAEFSSTTVFLAKDLADNAEEIGTNLADEEILAVHSHYADYTENFLGYIENMVTAIEHIDAAQTEEAEEKMSSAGQYYTNASSAITKFNEELNTLTEKYELSLDYQN